MSVEEEKDAKILANKISGEPKITDKSDGINSAHDNTNHKKKKHYGLFLRLENKDDERLERAKIITSIFDGTIPLWYYYKDEKKYVCARHSDFVEVNPTMLEELKRILGSDNVVYIAP